MENNAKEVLIKAIQIQPEGSTANEILQELLFQQIILEGLEDERAGRMISHEDFGKTIKSWAK